MKVLLSGIFMASALLACSVSSAQVANGVLTRREVRAQVVSADRCGTLHQSKTQYPASHPSTIGAACEIDSYGSSWEGSSQPISPFNARHSLYSGH